MYTAPRIMAQPENSATQKPTRIAPIITSSSPTKEPVPGRPILAMVNSIASVASTGMRAAVPPKPAIRRLPLRAPSIATTKNRPAMMMPCDSITNTAPSMPTAFRVNSPTSTSPMCENEEYATSRFMSVCASAMIAA